MYRCDLGLTSTYHLVGVDDARLHDDDIDSVMVFVLASSPV